MFASRQILSRTFRAVPTFQAGHFAACTAMSMQKAVNFTDFGGIEVLKYGDVPKPKISQGQVLVRNEYIGVNFIDTYHRSGLYKRHTPSPKTPSILGEEGAGTIEEVGSGDLGLQKGDKVVYLKQSHLGGSYAEYTAVDADAVTKVPQGVDIKEAAAVLLQGLTAYSMIAIATQVQKDEWALVHAAAGGTGSLLVQLLRNIGAKVIGTTSTPEKAQLARQHGAHEVILYTQEDVLEKVLQLTNGSGVKYVFDGVGKATFDISLNSLDYLGWFVCFGNASGKPEPFDILRLSEKSLRLLRPSLHGTYAADPALKRRHTAELLEFLRQGKITAQIFKVYKLSEAAQAQTDLTSRKTTGKLLLQPDSLA